MTTFGLGFPLASAAPELARITFESGPDCDQIKACESRTIRHNSYNLPLTNPRQVRGKGLGQNSGRRRRPCRADDDPPAIGTSRAQRDGRRRWPEGTFSI